MNTRERFLEKKQKCLGVNCCDPGHWKNHASKREREAEAYRRINNLWANMADAGRAAVLAPILSNYSNTQTGIVAPSFAEQILAQLLGTDVLWIRYLEGFFNNKMTDGPLSWGCENDGGAILGKKCVE